MKHLILALIAMLSTITMNVNLQALPTGIYLLSYNDGNKRTTKKLFINR